MADIMETIFRLSKKKHGKENVTFYNQLDIIVIQTSDGEIHKISREKLKR